MTRQKPQNPKVAALRQSGTLNSSPESIQDELFLSHPFFDARDLVQVKYEMLRRVEKDGWTISKAARAFGFSRPAFYAAQDDVKCGGLPGLLPSKRGPKGAHKLTDEVLEFVDQLRTQDPDITQDAIIKAIQATFRTKVHRRSLERAQGRRGKGQP